MTSASMPKWQHLLGAASLQRQDIEGFLQLVTVVKQRVLSGTFQSPAPSGLAVSNLFFENSTRTKTSFEVAEQKLGLVPVSLAMASSSLSKGESLYDTVATVGSIASTSHHLPTIVVIRHSSSGAADYVAKRCRVQVINAGDGTNEHPSQGLLDAFTLQERWGGFEGKTVAIIGDIRHSRVARSNLHILPKLGAHVRLFAPKTLLDPMVALGKPNVSIVSSFEAAVDGADAVMMLRIQQERMGQGLLSTMGDYTRAFGLTDARYDKLPASTFIMHPGPMVRGLEISPRAADSINSLVLQQTENGVFVRMCILLRLLGLDVAGATP